MRAPGAAPPPRGARPPSGALLGRPARAAALSLPSPLRALASFALATSLLLPCSSAAQPSPREASLLDEIEDLEEEAERASTEVAALDRRLLALQDRMSEVDTALGPVRESIEARRGALSRRLRALYRLSPRGLLKVLFSARDHREAMKYSRHLWFIAREDARAIAGYRALIDDRTRLLAEHRSTLEALQGTREQRVASQRAAREAVDRRQAILTLIRREHRADDMALAQRERHGPTLEKALDASAAPLPAPRRSAFAAQKGHLVPPALGAVTRRFGRYTPAGAAEPLLHKGIDVGAAEGTPIRAVFRGTVRQAGWMRGFGNLAIIDHGDGWFTVYAHARRFTAAAGDTVESGQAIGEVGSTGSLVGPYLYFEIRYHGVPQNPLEWLDWPGADASRGP